MKAIKNIKNIKMIVSDLDNTLLHTDKTISDYTAGILNKCRQNGIKMVFATARPKRMVMHYLDIIPADALILHNGAFVYDGDKQIFHCGISSDITKNILRSISHDFPMATLSVEIDDVFYANFDAEFDDSTAIWNYNILNKLYDILPDKPAEKIIIGMASVNMSSGEGSKYFSKYLTDDLYLEMDSGRFIMIMNRGAKKSLAIKFLAERYGYNMNQIVSFGDDYNDVYMLKQCGTGVAVLNAIDEAKSAADYICESNDDDGVAKWIEANICK